MAIVRKEHIKQARDRFFTAGFQYKKVELPTNAPDRVAATTQKARVIISELERKRA